MLECNQDSKKLYSLFNCLTGTSKENPLPTTYDSDEEMANAFAEYFMDKIKGIQDYLEHHPIYQPTNLGSTNNRLTKFNEVSEEYVKITISKMATKSCKLDPLPTDIFKKRLYKVKNSYK